MTYRGLVTAWDTCPSHSGGLGFLPGHLSSGWCWPKHLASCCPRERLGMEFWVPVFGEHVGECSLPYTSFKDSFGREIALPSTGSLPK